jgi:hypothetical protein
VYLKFEERAVHLSQRIFSNDWVMGYQTASGQVLQVDWCIHNLFDTVTECGLGPNGSTHLVSAAVIAWDTE